MDKQSLGWLSTHVLDTAQGCPAADLEITLWQIQPDNSRQLLKTLRTNQDGRTEARLLTGAEFTIGEYELVFNVGDYFAKQVANLPQPAFLNHIPIRFGIADTAAHYHVPLLVSPWAYSTYRGS
jgi:5-hydroxyisourate hydrolase